ncbi:helix-turn-helix transcriptional regulator [uncultured Desulfosarcina sp.]|uniref:helix-turn-helix domain-containing protein n=1 Tax=uncultured Desulfosarcina sp. TaxID=218289 RepID=UPI0029C8240D|nr:helix-turn-helix transcriptional regulator [uncultured Desulfosarcina sp.]
MNLRLKMAILKKFPSQADFAQQVGCHESKVSQVVCGRRYLSPEETGVWKKELDCSIAIFKTKDNR